MTQDTVPHCSSVHPGSTAAQAAVLCREDASEFPHVKFFSSSSLVCGLLPAL